VNLPIRVGVIGAGVMGTRHARLYAELPGCELVGLFDPDTARAEKLIECFGGIAYRQLNHLLADVDAVSIVSPTTTHAAVAHRALDFNRHMLVEKPMTATATEARILADRARESGRVILVGHVERFNPVVLKLRQIITGQRIRRVTLRRIAPFNNRCLDTSVVNDLMIHDIDLVRSLFGSDVRTMEASGAAVCTDHIDQAVVELSLNDGPQVSLIASRVGDIHAREIDVVTEHTCILADLLHRSITVTSVPGSTGRSVTNQCSVPPGEPLRMELQHFLDSIRGAATPLIDGDAGLQAVEWVDRINMLIGEPRHDLQMAGQLGRRS